MHLFKNTLLSLFIISMLLISCKGDVSDAVNKAKEATEELANEATEKVADTMDKVADGVGEGMEAAKEKISEVAEAGSEAIAETLDSEKTETIVAPASDPKPKASTSNATTTKASTSSTSNNGKIPKPTAKTTGQTSAPPASKAQVEAPADADIPSNTSTNTTATTTTKGGNVLKEVEKPSGNVVKEKVEVGSISKPKASTSSGTSKTTKIGTAQAKFSHGPFDALLKKVVSTSGVVDYALLKANVQDLNTYCQSLEANPPASSLSKNEKLAYWMNAYNAYTLKLIADNYPVNSITDLNGGKPWDKKWIKLDSRTLSLNDIENVIIRPTFKDARIHFAVNCAAKSCPPIANYAFTGRNVETKMEALTKSFINSSSNNITKDKISVSKIFDWYKEDFGNLITFINKYSNVEVGSNATVEYMEYDWSLNGK